MPLQSILRDLNCLRLGSVNQSCFLLKHPYVEFRLLVMPKYRGSLANILLFS